MFWSQKNTHTLGLVGYHYESTISCCTYPSLENWRPKLPSIVLERFSGSWGG